MKYQKYLDKQPSLVNKNIVITGANSGIGYAFALQCAYKGANVYFACRNKERASKAIEAIKKETNNDNLYFLEYDQASLKSIDAFINKIKELNIEIYSLILNAGVFKPGKDLKTVDGYPLTIGTNYIGEFYLLNKLDDLINKTIKQIVIVSSFGRHFAPSNYLDYLKEDKNKLARAYFASKRMNYEVAGYIHEKHPDFNVKIMHPGIAVTRIVNNELHSFSKGLIWLGNIVLKIIANPQEKSSLCFFKAINDRSVSLNCCFPRGIFHVAGYPSKRKIKKIKSDQLVTASSKLFNL